MQLLRAHQCGQGEGDTIQRTVGALCRALFRLEVFPSFLARLAFIHRFAKDVRMPRFHLCADRGDHIGEAEQTGFLGDARVKHDLEQQIAKLVAQGGHVVTLDRVGNLIGFLDRVRRDRGEALREIPFAAAMRITQACHNPEEAFEGS